MVLMMFKALSFIHYSFFLKVAMGMISDVIFLHFAFAWFYVVDFIVKAIDN